MPRKYRPGIDPAPKVWLRGYVSKAQRRHFMQTPSLAKYRAGMDYFTPPRGNPETRGKTSISNKLAQLPNRKRAGGKKKR